jgi:hypothetical protein
MIKLQLVNAAIIYDTGLRDVTALSEEL